MAIFQGQELTTEGRNPTNIGGLMYTPADHSFLEGFDTMTAQGDDTLYGGPEATFDPNNPSWGLGNDLLQGYAGSDTLYGGADDDILFGNARPGREVASDGADQLYGGDGQDWLSGNEGNDTLDGGTGTDTAVLAGLQSDYTFSGTATDFTATRTATGETDTLRDIENVTFNNSFDSTQRVAVADLLPPPDTTKPSVTVDIVDTALNDADNSSQVTFTFSEAIAAGSFTLDDASVANGVLSGLVIAADGLSATATFTATDNVNGTGSVSVAADRFTDAAGNQNTASNTDTVAINTVTSSSSIIEGGPGPDTLRGTPDSDIMDGKGGNDTLLGSADADQMFGGPGRDTVRYTRTVTLDLENEDRSTGQARGDTFDSIERFQFSNGSDEGFGDADANQFFGGSGSDHLHGAGGNDILRGENGRDQLFGEDGNDRLFGGNGRDLLVGGLGRDRMNGDAGADRYDFNTVQESSVGSQRDVVYFSGEDRIDLRTIDADEDTVGNQAFRWVNRNDLDAAFTGRDGQLRFSNGILRGDTDGDKVADFEIKVVGFFSSGDVIL
ncbi:Ig-like domain-containing protein [Microvirga yunnanensis]|uniref:Ig-like domain-containing protein n=1 Tax=Microvirga yunnanensis TaxID=2953740 RepID=UPI0021C5B262|nr:Ig-like domain-containing protein [Microvirga sp. HBU65207]